MYIYTGIYIYIYSTPRVSPRTRNARQKARTALLMEGEYGDAPEDFRPLSAQPMYKFVQRRGNIGSVIFETAEAPQQLRTAALVEYQANI